jgi:D-serine deaminase-like pyridoxal phosphate-dependent protein
VAKLLEAVSLCRKSGIDVPIVTGGSTGSYNIDSEIEGITELQAGSYALMDARYRTIGSKQGDPNFDDFGCALTVLTRVISKKYPNKAAIDAGNKAMTRETDVVKNWPGVEVRPAGAEYGMLVWQNAEREPKLGDLAELVITNLDMSVNMFDRMYVCRNDQVVDVFSVLGRSGPAQR